jgi:hypothetical protein
MKLLTLKCSAIKKTQDIPDEGFFETIVIGEARGKVGG